MKDRIEASGAFKELIRRREIEHPTSEEVVAYHLGELPPNRVEGMREHLAICPACASEVGQLAHFGEICHLAAGHDVTEGRPPFWRRWVALPIAAALLTGFGLAFSLRLAEQDEGHVDMPRRVIDLTADSYRGGATRKTVGIDLPLDRDAILLELQFDYRPDTGLYKVELVNPGGDTVLSAEVKPLNSGYLNLVIPRSDLGVGTYRLEVSALPGAESPPAVVQLEVRLGSAP